MTEFTTDPTGALVTLVTVDANGVTGTVRAVFTRGDHVHVTAGTSGMGEPMGLTYRGKSYAVALHLFAACGWASDDNPMTRPRVYDAKAQDAAPTFKAAVLAAVTEAVAAMVAKHPEIPLHAEVNRLEREAERAAGEVVKARKAYDDATANRAQLLTLLRGARDALAERP